MSAGDIIKKGLCLLLALAFLPAVPARGAAPESEEEAEEGAAAVIRTFLEEHPSIPGQVCLGYRDPVTGETAWVEPDRKMFAASLYKVALNMIWADRIAAGEADPTETLVLNLPLEHLMKQSLTYSNNELSVALMGPLGGQSASREGDEREVQQRHR